MLQSSPEDYRYYYWIGRACQLALKVDEGQKWLQEGLAITKQTLESHPTNVTAHFYAALFNSRLGMFSTGESFMKSALNMDSTSTEALFRVANMYSIQKNKEKAFEALHKALQKEYDFSELLNPDLSLLSFEPEYIQQVSRKMEGSWPALQ